MSTKGTKEEKYTLRENPKIRPIVPFAKQLLKGIKGFASTPGPFKSSTLKKASTQLTKYGESSVDRIEKIRSDNNRLWMTLLRIALEKAPKRTKAILAEIKANDEAISRNMQELTK